MEEHECCIGQWLDYDNTHLITLNELKEEIRHNNETYRYAIKEFGISIGKIMLLSDYFDGRRSTNLYRFDYCPYCGNKIDWKKMKKEYENENQDKK